MLEILEKFVKNLEKLEKYYILRHEKEHLIVGTKIEFLEHKPDITQVFSTYKPKPVEKTLPVFFLISVAQKPLELDKFFLKKELPVLSVNKYKYKLTIEKVEELLEQFITNNFKY
jgi:hypothetical protein